MPPNTYYGAPITDLASRDFRLSVTCYAPQAVIPPHEHANAYICIGSAGGFVERSGRKECEVRAHDLVYHPPGHRHADRFASFGARCVNLELEPAWFARLPVSTVVAEPVYASDPELRRLGRALLREIEQPDSSTPLAMDGLLLDLFSKFRGPLRRRNGRPPGWLLAVRERLQSDFTESYRLGELADAAGMHPVHVAREFRRQFGCTPGGYQRRLRIEAARVMLAASDRPLSDIALELGFCSQSHFSRVFADVTGMSPRAWRSCRRP